MFKFLVDMGLAVVGSLIHNSLYLFFGILMAVLLKVYVDPEKVKRALIRRSNISIPASVAFGALTPLCACGTMAVIIALLTTALPWGPIMAFLTSSPLMSPDGFILLAGIVGLKFAIALTIASIIIGLGSGYLTHIIEKRTDFLRGQTRFTEELQQQTCTCGTDRKTVATPSQTCDCGAGGGSVVDEVCCGDSSTTVSKGFLGLLGRIKWREIGESLINLGLKQILLYFSIFVAIGFLINRLVPASIITSLFGAKNILAVPLAALIGLPIYVNGESAIPLIKALMAGGASGGTMLAFMITGPGTSAGVLAGIATIMKRRAIILYTLFLLLGGIGLGYLYDLLLAMGL